MSRERHKSIWLVSHRDELAGRVENILKDIVDVSDQNGNLPLGYQQGYIDPRGRVFELSVRKRF